MVETQLILKKERLKWHYWIRPPHVSLLPRQALLVCTLRLDWMSIHTKIYLWW